MRFTNAAAVGIVVHSMAAVDATIRTRGNDSNLGTRQKERLSELLLSQKKGGLNVQHDDVKMPSVDNPASFLEEKDKFQQKGSNEMLKNRPVECTPKRPHVREEQEQRDDADVGILGCGKNEYCVESDDSNLGGFCMPSDQQGDDDRHLNDSGDRQDPEFLLQYCDMPGCECSSTQVFAYGCGYEDSYYFDLYCRWGSWAEIYSLMAVYFSPDGIFFGEYCSYDRVYDDPCYDYHNPCYYYDNPCYWIYGHHHLSNGPVPRWEDLHFVLGYSPVDDLSGAEYYQDLCISLEECDDRIDGKFILAPCDGNSARQKFKFHQSDNTLDYDGLIDVWYGGDTLVYCMQAGHDGGPEINEFLRVKPCEYYDFDNRLQKFNFDWSDAHKGRIISLKDWPEFCVGHEGQTAISGDRLVIKRCSDLNEGDAFRAKQ